ncbi:hypothetical protein PanWU01x14_248700 [Parasponia andersonii]|uniref:Vitellogenin-like protein n=1 Tax=Parasponia andersonii TaxID=3476 RepID=A0A2P5BDA9_PARAD|nr:hypothetical protein PanWU01x14_248700 [Parasponia andersonii]
MANILRRSKDTIMGHGGAAGRPRPDGRCKRHPKHRQSPGVCSLCLRERLSQLNKMDPTSSSRRITSAASGSSTTSSLSSYYSSESEDEESECESPMQYCRYRYGGYNHRKGSSSNSVSSFMLSGNNVLKKSRSLAFVSRREERSDGDRQRRAGGGGGGGFWSKLIHPKHSNDNRTSSTDHQETRFMHSRTVRERSVLPQMVH